MKPVSSDLTADDPHNWNFDEDKVPDSQLVSCCYWEYARESVFIRETLRRYRDWWKTGGDVTAQEAQQCFRDMAPIVVACRNVPKLFADERFFGREHVWQEEEPGKRNYRHPCAPPITGQFPKPWQKLDPDEKRVRSRVSKDSAPFVPVEHGVYLHARTIAQHCEQQASEQERRWREWAREHAKPDGSPKNGAPDPPKREYVRPGLFVGATESLLLRIAWDFFTDSEIAKHFCKIVPALRPLNRQGPPSLRGHDPGDWRAALERLGIMRLMHHYSFEQMCEIVGQSASAKSADRDKYSFKAECKKERRKALDNFQRLFRFLKDEMPISWEPLPGGGW